LAQEKDLFLQDISKLSKEKFEVESALELAKRELETAREDIEGLLSPILHVIKGARVQLRLAFAFAFESVGITSPDSSEVTFEAERSRAGLGNNFI
jgi:hypothetical protein